jgi:hypothetical protein
MRAVAMADMSTGSRTANHSSRLPKLFVLLVQTRRGPSVQNSDSLGIRSFGHGRRPCMHPQRKHQAILDGASRIPVAAR